MKIKRILLCEDSLDGILSAVYEAYTSRYGLHDIELELFSANAQTSFFSEYRIVSTDTEHAASVAEAIKRKISEYAFEAVFGAACSDNPAKAQAIYRFIVYGFHLGAAVTGCLSEPDIHLVMKLSRQVFRETDHLYGFLRFEAVGNGLLLAKIKPRHRQLEQMAGHFSQRYPKETFIICDVGRKQACVHKPGAGCAFFDYTGQEAQIERQNLKNGDDSLSTGGDEYEKLWKAFVEAVTIKERKNPKCQMTMMPKRYWEYMPEMADKL